MAELHNEVFLGDSVTDLCVGAPGPIRLDAFEHGVQKL